MKKSPLLLVLCCLTGIMVSAHDWVTFTRSNPQPPVINLIQSNNQQVQYTVEVCGMFKENLTEGSENFQRIEIPCSGKFAQTGEPELPYIRQLIAIPECDNVILTVNITSQIDFSNYNIYPAPDYEEVQGPGNSVYLEEVFSKNEAVYDQNTYLPGMNAEIVSTGYLRGQKYAEVYLYPVQFNPVTKHIIVYTNYHVNLGFSNPATNVNVNTGIFNNVATYTFINYVSSGIRASINDNMEGNGNINWIELDHPEDADDIIADYLIICSGIFFEPHNSDVYNIALHRATYNGFDVAILNADNIISDDVNFFFEGLNQIPPDYTHIKEQRIRTCIRRIYEGANALHTYDGKLGYVQLIGDVPQNGINGVPGSYDNVFDFPSDYYYSCVTKDGSSYDLTGDLFIGRFCVDNDLDNDELKNIVNKTIYYESEATFYDESEVPPPRGWRNETGVFVQIDPHYDYHQPYLEFIESLIPSYFIVDEIDGAEENYEDQVYSALNEGVGTFTYFGHGYKNGWSTISTDDLESNLINEYKAPVVHGIACESGYFDFGSDCFGEAITTYSGTKGFTGYLGACRSVGCKADINDICYPPKYFQELIPYTIFNDLSHITGEYILESKMRNEANVPEYKYAFNFFGDPALNIMAQGFEVTDDITLPPITTISTKITVRSGVTLTVPTDGNLRFENNGKLIIEEGANLIFCRDDTIHAVSGMDSIIVYGNIAMGGEYASNNSFLTEENASFVIEIRNYDLELSIYGDQFTGVTLSAYTKSFLVDNCTFIDSYLKYYRNNDQTFELTNSQFTNSTVIASIGDMAATDRGTVIITGCDFVNSMDDVVINIGPYKNFMLLHDTLIYDAGNGINIHTSGSSVGHDHYIKECSIEYNLSSTADTSCGIEIYHSYADIQNNLIKNNTYGVVCLDRSNVRLLGNESAQSADETQQIINNCKNQVFAIAGSFPHEFHWNVIYNNHPGHDTLVTYHTCIIPGSPFLYVEYNYWGPHFDTVGDLHPTGKYFWDPVWIPPWINLKSTGDDEVLFHGAEQAIIDGDYADAESDFKEIIENYPDSKYLQASVKELLALKRIYDHDFTGLKSYLDSVPTLQQDTETMNLTAHVSNWCNIENEDYITAINWFESQIENPPSFEDSIFAIIDLSYTYTLMESGGSRSSSYVGRYPEYKFATRKAYEKNREYLIDLLFKISGNLPDDQTPINNDTTIFSLIQNFPNPFRDQTDIIFSIPTAARVSIKVYNVLGALVEIPYDEFVESGEHRFTWSTKNLSEGIYYYSLEVNNEKKDVKKMILLR